MRPGPQEIFEADDWEWLLIWVKCCQWWQVSAASSWGHCGYCGEKPGYDGPIGKDQDETDTIKQQIAKVYE